MTRRQAWDAVCRQLLLRNQRSAEELGWKCWGQNKDRNWVFAYDEPGTSMQLLVWANKMRPDWEVARTLPQPPRP